MKKNIAIVTGGDSSELVISLKSADQVQKHLSRDLYESYIVYIRENDWHVRLEPNPREQTSKENKQTTGEPVKIPIDRDNFSFIKDGVRVNLDYAFIALHGPPGEDGQLQTYFDERSIPYSTSSSASLKLSFDKYACKEFLAKSNVLSARGVIISKNSKGDWQLSRGIKGQGGYYDPQKVLDVVGLPCFVKPNRGGSSFGISRINHSEELTVALENALAEDSKILVETFIPGSELTCGVLKTTSREFIFPVTEIITENEFFDYEAKYTVGMADEITPANIPEELARECQNRSSKIYDLMDCAGLVRIDFINHKGELYFLELNGVPGMSRESIIPKQIRTLGLTESEIYNLIIHETSGW